MQREHSRTEPSKTDAKNIYEGFIPSRGVCELIGIEENTLATWRRERTGPPYYRIHGHLIRYDRAEVLAWIRSQRVRATPGVRTEGNA